MLASPEIEVLSSGYIWTEGPVWLAAEKALYFTDVPAATIFRWSEADGVTAHVRDAGGWDGSNIEDIETLAEPGSNGMHIDPSDPEQVFICQHPLRRVIRVKLGAITPGTRMCENEEHWTVVADKTPSGGRLNSPNDVCVGSDGAIWFTDPPYGMLEKARFSDEFFVRQNYPPPAPHIKPEEEGGPKSYLDEKAAAAAGTKGVYRVPPGGGAIELGTDLHERPNGLAFSPDFKVRHRSPVDSLENLLTCWLGWSDSVGGGLVDPQPDVERLHGAGGPEPGEGPHRPLPGNPRRKGPNHPPPSRLVWKLVCKIR